MKPRELGISALGIVETATLHDQVYGSLAGAIMSGGFRPGEALSYKALAQQFGISEMPVRDAMRRLAAEGAVIISPKRAVRIPDASKKRIDELEQARLALEGVATAQAASLIPASTLAALEKLARDMVRCAGDGDWRAYLTHNQKFHFAIYEAARSDLFVRLIMGLWLQVGPMMTYFANEGPDRTLTTHDEIIEALRQRDGVLARQLMEEDIRDGMMHLRRVLSSDPA